MKPFLLKRLILISLFNFLLGCGQNQTKFGAENQTENIKEDMESVFVGTYTKKEAHVDGQADGIYVLYRNPTDGHLNFGDLIAEVTNPSFVKTSKNGKFLFAVSEIGESDAESGYIYSFKIIEGKSLQEISKISTESFAPAHIELDQTGNYIFVSNYVGGVVMVYRIDADGNLKKKQRIDLENPQDSHAHSVTISNNNQHAYIADLGNDKIWIFDFNAKEGSLVAGEQPYVNLKQGAGPRHFTISGEGNFAYSVNELNNSVTAFRVLKGGGLEKTQDISTLPAGYLEPSYTADIHIHPSGKFLYASNRGHNSIVTFRVEEKTGKLSLLDHTSTKGDFPRSFAISSDGEYLYVANQNSDNIATFKIDKETGELLLLGEPLEVLTPVNIEISHKVVRTS